MYGISQASHGRNIFLAPSPNVRKLAHFLQFGQGHPRNPTNLPGIASQPLSPPEGAGYNKVTRDSEELGRPCDPCFSGNLNYVYFAQKELLPVEYFSEIC